MEVSVRGGGESLQHVQRKCSIRMQLRSIGKKKENNKENRGHQRDFFIILIFIMIIIIIPFFCIMVKEHTRKTKHNLFACQ